MKKISLFIFSSALAVATLVGCNSAAEPVVEEPVLEEVVEETTQEPMEEVVVEPVVEEPVEETVKFVFGQEEPEYHQVFYGSDEINAKVEELKPLYPDMSDADILALVNFVNGYDYKLGAVGESREVYGKSDLTIGSIDSNIKISDFAINPQAREYALVLEECYKNDRTQWENYMRENSNFEYTYDFIFSGYDDGPTANTAITCVKYWEMTYDMQLSYDVLYGDNYEFKIVDIFLGEFSFENEQ